MRGFNDLESVYDTGEFLPLTFYFGAPYSIPEGNARASWYGISGTPNVMIGGIVNHIGGTALGLHVHHLRSHGCQSAGQSRAPWSCRPPISVWPTRYRRVGPEIDVEQNLSG